MFSCAYELDIDITDIRQDLLEHFDNIENKQVSKYGDIFYREVTNSFTERFDNCFLNHLWIFHTALSIFLSIRHLAHLRDF